MNAGRSEEQLEDIPHFRILDLAGIARFPVEVGGRKGTTVITDEILEHFEIDKDKFFLRAIQNTVAKGFSVRLMSDVLTELAPYDVMSEEQYADPQVFAVTNSDKHFGAAAMLDADTFRMIADRCDSDLFILPSSIHEVLVLKAEGADAGELAEMVRNINRTNVKPEDFLSDNVYLYKRDLDKIVMA